MVRWRSNFSLRCSRERRNLKFERQQAPNFRVTTTGAILLQLFLEMMSTKKRTHSWIDTLRHPATHGWFLGSRPGVAH